MVGGYGRFNGELFERLKCITEFNKNSWLTGMLPSLGKLNDPFRWVETLRWEKRNEKINFNFICGTDGAFIAI